jgi:hypothetical protein
MCYDHSGIGLAISAMFQTYRQSARTTGRTTSLLESVKDGDRIIVLNGQEKTRLERELRDRKLNVDVFVMPLNRINELSHRAPSTGRTVFEHTWVEAFYELAIERAQKEIDVMQRETSGNGTAHIETMQRARAIWHG